MNRLDRLTAILIQLQSKRVVRAQEIAERFGISLRTVYRDVRSLETAGVPVIGEAGIGYSLVEGYRLPPVQFTTDEAAAFLTAEKLVGHYTDAGVSAQYRSGMLKIRSVLRFSDKDFMEQLDEAVQVLAPGTGALSSSEILPVMLQSIAQKELLSIQYAGKKDETAQKRLIEPIGVFYQNEAWYVLAWCHLREDVRNFKLDRMLAVTKTGRLFEAREQNLQAYMEQQEGQAQGLKASIRVPNEMLPFIERQKMQQGWRDETNHGTETTMSFETASYSYLARWALQFADKVLAFSPPELEQTFRQILQAAQKNWSP
jgi:predicted DNA-binding transcriptional regulator YafY